MNLREERRRLNQARVVQAALDIFTEKGITGVTIAAIAQHMNASVGGLYRYFPNKEAIFVALQVHALKTLDGHVERLLQSIDEQCESSEQIARLKLAVIFDLWDRFRQLSSRHYQVLYVFSSSFERKLDDSSAHQVDAFLRPILERVAQALAECAEEGMINHGDHLKRTYIMWATLQGLAHFEKRDHLQPEGLTARALKIEVMRSYLVAWGADAQTTDMICHLKLPHISECNEVT